MNIWREILRGVRPGQYSDRAIRERRQSERVCICPSHASNLGECVVHDAHGRVRPGYPLVIDAPHITKSLGERR